VVARPLRAHGLRAQRAGLRAADAAGAALPWTKLDGSAWGVVVRGPRAARTARVRYRVYANDLSGTFSVLDTAHANWNGASLFMYVAGRKADPVTLAVTPPAGWVVVNGAQGNPGYEGAAPNTFRFPNYDELIDAPTEVAPAAALTVDTFTVDGRRYRAMIHHNGPRPRARRRASWRSCGPSWRGRTAWSPRRRSPRTRSCSTWATAAATGWSTSTPRRSSTRSRGAPTPRACSAACRRRRTSTSTRGT
jgi:hypothetical protein